MISAGEDVIEAVGSISIGGDIAYVAEEMEFRQDDGQMVETIKTTILDENGTTCSETVSAHKIN